MGFHGSFLGWFVNNNIFWVQFPPISNSQHLHFHGRKSLRIRGLWMGKAAYWRMIYFEDWNWSGSKHPNAVIYVYIYFYMFFSGWSCFFSETTLANIFWYLHHAGCLDDILCSIIVLQIMSCCRDSFFAQKRCPSVSDFSKDSSFLGSKNCCIRSMGGWYHIITQLAIYKWYISGIYCQLGDYMVPTYHLLREPGNTRKQPAA